MIPVVMASNSMDVTLNDDGTLTAKATSHRGWIKVGAAGGRIVLLDKSEDAPVDVEAVIADLADKAGES